MLCVSKHKSTELQAIPFWRISVSLYSYWWVSPTPAHVHTHWNCSRDSMKKQGQKQVHSSILKLGLNYIILWENCLQTGFCKDHLRNSGTDPTPQFTLKVCESRDVQYYMGTAESRPEPLSTCGKDQSALGAQVKAIQLWHRKGWILVAPLLDPI